MDFAVSRSQHWTVVSINGRSDAFTFPRLKCELDQLLAEGALCIAVEMAQAKFLSISTIDYFCRVAKTLQTQGGRFAVVGAGEKIKRNFAIFSQMPQILVVSKLAELPTNRAPDAYLEPAP